MDPRTRPADAPSRHGGPSRRPPSPSAESTTSSADAPVSGATNGKPEPPVRMTGAKLGPLSGVVPRVPDLVRRGDSLVRRAEPRPPAPDPAEVAERARSKELQGLASRVNELSPVIEAAIADLGRRWTSATTMKDFRERFTVAHADCERTLKDRDLPAALRALERFTGLALDVQAKFIDKEDLPNGDLVKVGIEGGTSTLHGLESQMRQTFAKALAQVDRMLEDPAMPAASVQRMRRELLDLQQEFGEAVSDADLPEAREAFTRTVALHHRMLGQEPRKESPVPDMRDSTAPGEGAGS
ncbi:MAG: hypothetical protein VKP72_03415 [bacterium]|nr:hypothetical protein [bacterium]